MSEKDRVSWATTSSRLVLLQLPIRDAQDAYSCPKTRQISSTILSDPSQPCAQEAWQVSGECSPGGTKLAWASTCLRCPFGHRSMTDRLKSPQNGPLHYAGRSPKQKPPVFVSTLTSKANDGVGKRAWRSHRLRRLTRCLELDVILLSRQPATKQALLGTSTHRVSRRG